MRLRKLTIHSFRGFGDAPTPFDLDSNVVVLGGPNGYGKTSFFDAILWCLTNDIKRLRGTRDSTRKGVDFLKDIIKNTYSNLLPFVSFFKMEMNIWK